MTPEELFNLLTGIFKENEIVGLTVTEFLPWDSVNLKNTLSELDIFR